jgi:hypothetical protein
MCVLDIVSRVPPYFPLPKPPPLREEIKTSAQRGEVGGEMLSNIVIERLRLSIADKVQLQATLPLEGDE